MEQNLVYFQKEILGNAFIVQGKPVPFEPLDGNRGVIALNPATDATTIEALNKSAGRMGIIKISAQEYEDLKKNHPFNPSQPQYHRGNMPLRVFPTRQPKGFGHEAAGVAGANVSTQAPAAPAAAPELPPTPSIPSPTGRPLTGAMARAIAEQQTDPAQEAPGPKPFRPAVRRVARKAAEPSQPETPAPTPQ